MGCLECLADSFAKAMDFDFKAIRLIQPPKKILNKLFAWFHYFFNNKTGN